jgi:hypothetical protein
VLIFVFGMLNFTPMTTLPPLLQGVSGYPDSVIGFVLGARGIGTAVAFFLMIFASRLDPRAMIAGGFCLLALAGWQLAQLDMNLTAEAVFWPMALQGFGVGVLWVPITMVSFSTFKPAAVADASAVYHMVRNAGSSIHSRSGSRSRCAWGGRTRPRSPRRCRRTTKRSRTNRSPASGARPIRRGSPRSRARSRGRRR